MGSNPELLRQSTHSLLHKTQLKDTGTPADLLVLKKQTSQKQKQPTATISPSAKQQATEKQPIEQEATEEPEQVIADKAQELIGKPSSTTY